MSFFVNLFVENIFFSAPQFAEHLQTIPGTSTERTPTAQDPERQFAAGNLQICDPKLRLWSPLATQLGSKIRSGSAVRTIGECLSALRSFQHRSPPRSSPNQQSFCSPPCTNPFLAVDLLSSLLLCARGLRSQLGRQGRKKSILEFIIFAYKANRKSMIVEVWGVQNP